MLTINEAWQKGIDACIQKIGWDFVANNPDCTCTAYFVLPNESRILCMVCADNEKPNLSEWDAVRDTLNKPFPIDVRCLVDCVTGEVYITQCSTYKEVFD